MWTTLSFDTDKDFDKAVSEVEYDNFKIEVVQGSASQSHNLYVPFSQDTDFLGSLGAGLRFLSELSWLFNSRVNYFGSVGSGQNKIPIREIAAYYWIKNAICLTDYRQIAIRKEQKIALGIYREARNSNSRFYEFLSYFRIINMTNRTRLMQVAWINNNFSIPRDVHNVRKTLAEKGIADVGKHLYESGRCAIAHASLTSGGDIADPNNPADLSRINGEVTLVRELAELLINRDLGVPTYYEMLRM